MLGLACLECRLCTYVLGDLGDFLDTRSSVGRICVIAVCVARRICVRPPNRVGVINATLDISISGTV